MGGMAKGGECATLTIAALFASLIRSNDPRIDNKLKQATLHANMAVHKFANGNGGATLSALLIEGTGEACLANVGDSRIYAIPQGEPHLRRVTVDDTLEDAFGGQGRELVQYIGVGAHLLPRVAAIAPTSETILITTDGAHHIDPGLFEQIIVRAGDHRRASERIIALARWLGGRDNASVASFRMPDVVSRLHRAAASPVILWSARQQLQLVLMSSVNDGALTQDSIEPTDKAASPSTTAPDRQDAKSRRKTQKRVKKQPEKHQIELKIESDETQDGSNS